MINLIFQIQYKFILSLQSYDSSAHSNGKTVVLLVFSNYIAKFWSNLRPQGLALVYIYA